MSSANELLSEKSYELPRDSLLLSHDEIVNNHKYYLEQKNNSPQIIFLSIIIGCIIAGLQILSENSNDNIKIKDISLSLSFFITFIIISIIKKSLIKKSLSHLVISLLFIIALYLSSRENNDTNDFTHTIFIISCIFLFFGSFCFDKSSVFKYTHVISCFIILGIFGYFEYKIIIKGKVKIIKIGIKWIYIAVSCLFYVISFFLQQNCLNSGKEVYNYIQLQGFIGGIFYTGVVLYNKEYQKIWTIQYKNIGSIVLYFIAQVLLIIIVPFFSKKFHPIAVFLFSYWKYSILFSYRVKIVRWWEVLVVNIIFFLMMILYFLKNIRNIGPNNKGININYISMSKDSLDDTNGFNPLIKKNELDDISVSSISKSESNSIIFEEFNRDSKKGGYFL